MAPVFESLLIAGIIIPCPNSPVCTPVVLVKKIQEKPPDKRRFVQDLRAINAAFRAPAPTVQNPHTIISQVPPETIGSLWLTCLTCFSVYQSTQIANFG